MWQQAPGGWIWWSWNPRHYRWEQTWYADVPVVQWHPVEIERPASPKAGRRRRGRSRHERAQAPVTPPRQQQRTVTPPGQRAQKPTPNPQSIRVQKPKINPDDEVVYVRVPFSLKDLPQGTYKSQLEWCETVGVRFVFRHHGASKKHKWDSSRITLQGPQAHHAWSVLLKEYKEILPAPLWKKVSKVGILYIRGNYDGKIDDELKDESDEDSEVDFKDEPKDDVTKLPLKSFEKEGPPDDDDEDESEDETETKQELAGDGGSPPGAGDGWSLPAVKVKEEAVDYEDDDAGTAPAVPGEEPVNDDVPSPAETESEVETLPGGHVRLVAGMQPVSKFMSTAPTSVVTPAASFQVLGKKVSNQIYEN